MCRGMFDTVVRSDMPQAVDCASGSAMEHSAAAQPQSDAADQLIAALQDRIEALEGRASSHEVAIDARGVACVLAWPSRSCTPYELPRTFDADPAGCKLCLVPRLQDGAVVGHSATSAASPVRATASTGSTLIEELDRSLSDIQQACHQEPHVDGAE